MAHPRRPLVGSSAQAAAVEERLRRNTERTHLSPGGAARVLRSNTVMNTPALLCPACSRPLEYHATVEMIDPPVGKLDTGYCAQCERLFERIRETATFYDTTLWPPLCRVCRQPVTYHSLGGASPGEEMVLFACQVHPTELWVWSRLTERWRRKA